MRAWPRTGERWMYHSGNTHAIFENPQNGYQERVPRLAWLWMLLFGVFYMIVRNLWTHVAIVAATMALALMMPAVWLIAIPLWVGYAASAPALIRSNYLKRGWREVAVPDQQELY